MYFFSTDVCDPQAEMSVVDPSDGHLVRKVKGFLVSEIITNADGSQSLKAENGQVYEQYPNIPGGFSLMNPGGDYSRCNVEGPLVAFLTRKGDQPFVYTIKRLP